MSRSPWVYFLDFLPASHPCRRSWTVPEIFRLSKTAATFVSSITCSSRMTMSGFLARQRLFDAQRGSTVAREASAANLSVRKAGEYLNAPRVQRDMLYRTGLIVPRVRGSDYGAVDQFAPEDPGRLPRPVAGRRQASEGGHGSSANGGSAVSAATCPSWLTSMKSAAWSAGRSTAASPAWGDS